MIKQFIFTCTFFLLTNLNAQEKLTGFYNSLKTYFGEIKSVFPVVNEKNDDFSLFFVDDKNIYGYLLNNSFKIKDSLLAEDKSRKFKTVIGSHINENNEYFLYLTNNQRDQFAVYRFSYNNEEPILKEFELGSKMERFVQTISVDNKFYIISIVKNSSLLGLYVFDDEGNYKRHTVDFSDDELINEKDKKTNLYDLIVEGSSNLTNSEIKKIEEDFPNSIDVTSELQKLYIQDNTVYISFDDNSTYTQIIEFNLNTLDKNFRKLEKPLPATKSNQKKTNSFLAGNYIYFFATTNNVFVFYVNDFNSAQVLKKYMAIDTDSIRFKNTSIIQVGGMYDKYREMESTKKFVRKINSGRVGITSYKIGNLYQVTMGGILETNPSGGGMMVIPGMPIASFGNVSVFFNPAQFAFSQYANTRSTYFKGLFDENFEHIEGQPKKNAFDKIKDFDRGKGDYIYREATSVFKYKDYFIVGNLLFNSKEYVLYKFED